METTIGVERESFIVNLHDGKIVPKIGILLPELHKKVDVINCSCINKISASNFGYELFAGQIEDRTSIHSSIDELVEEMKLNEKIIKTVSKSLGLGILTKDYICEEELGELIVNPFDVRHQKIWSTISHEKKVSASQVAAIHVHVGGLDSEQVVKILNVCRENIILKLASLGDFSEGKRLVNYKNMSGSNGVPPMFTCFEEVIKYIAEKNGERNVWDLVRYKITTNTVEFRMFGATSDYNKIRNFVIECLKLIP